MAARTALVFRPGCGFSLTADGLRRLACVVAMFAVRGRIGTARRGGGRSSWCRICCRWPERWCARLALLAATFLTCCRTDRARAWWRTCRTGGLARRCFQADRSSLHPFGEVNDDVRRRAPPLLPYWDSSPPRMLHRRRIERRVLFSPLRPRRISREDVRTRGL